MALPCTIRYYIDGGTTPIATAFSADGVTFSSALDLPDGSHSITVTAQRVGEAESLPSSPSTVVVGANTAPTIISPLDWDEIKTSSITVTAQANNGETVRFYANGVYKAQGTANSSGVASATISFDSADTIGFDPVEVITAYRYISGNLSHPSTPVNVVVTAGHIPASGTTTLRLLHTSVLISMFRYWVGGTWDNEAICPGVISRALWRLNLGSGEIDGIVAGLPELHPISYLGGMAPGYMDSRWLREHLNRIAVSSLGVTAYHLKHDGSVYSAVPFWFDIALLTATAYFRGDRSSYAAYKSKILEILANLPVNANGLVRQGVQYTMRLRNHGWQGTPADHGESWYLAHTGGIGDTIGIRDPIYFPEVEGTARYAFAVRLLKKMALLESDSDTSAICDNALTNFKNAISSQIRAADGMLKQMQFPYGSNTENPGYTATAMAIAADAFANPSEKTTALSALNTMFSGSYYRTGGGFAGDWSNLSPVQMGTIQMAGKNSPVGDVQVNAQYAFPVFTGPFIGAIAQTDSAKARILAEDAVRFAIAWFQHGVFLWTGISWADHHGSMSRWSHTASHFMVPSHATAPWMQEADDKYADLSDIVVSGTLNSTATLQVPLGHRITGFTVTASSACTGTVEFYANEATNGQQGLISAGNNGPWPVTPTYGSDILMGSVTFSNSASAQITSGVKSFGAYSGGQIKVKVASITGTPPTNFTVTPKQTKVTPTFVSDATLGFTDNFATDRMTANNTDWTILEGSKATCSIQEREDTGPAGIARPPLRKTEFKTTELVANWTGLIETQSSFADGWVMLDKVQRTDATVNSSGQPSIYPECCAYFRVSSNKQNYIKVRCEYYLGYFRIVAEEYISGSLAGSYYPADQEAGYAPFRYAERGYDERYLMVTLKGNTVYGAIWDGGMMLPMSDGIGYGASPYGWGTVTLSGNITAAGMAGFGVKGPCRVDSVRICGMQTQPVPPGFILDTGLGIPKTEIIVPSMHLTSEYIFPASAKSCLRNEWGARVSDIVNDYNARWSY